MLIEISSKYSKLVSIIDNHSTSIQWLPQKEKTHLSSAAGYAGYAGYPAPAPCKCNAPSVAAWRGPFGFWKAPSFCSYGDFHIWGYPQIIRFWDFPQKKRTSLSRDSSIYGNLHMGSKATGESQPLIQWDIKQHSCENEIMMNQLEQQQIISKNLKADVVMGMT